MVTTIANSQTAAQISAEKIESFMMKRNYSYVRWTMNDSAALATIAPPIRLGIQGLPNLTDSMNAGGLYILIAETPSARFPILAKTLATALASGMTCNIVVHANAAAFIQRIESFSHLNMSELLSSDRLQFFEMQEEFSKKIFRFGADSFSKELEQFNIPQTSYLIFDQADELLSLHDLSLALEQVDILSKWFARNQITGLLIFSRTTEAHAGVLNALMDNLSGIVRLGVKKGGLELTFDYWQSPEGTIAGRNFRLTTQDSGLYQASTDMPETKQRADIGNVNFSPDQDEEQGTSYFFYMDPDLSVLEKQMAGTWQRVDTLLGMMHSTLSKRSATCILSFQRDTNLRQLAEAVHTLRLSLGRQARIVVQEKGASLRYQNEALLMRLGLNMVIHRDVPSGRLPLLLESLNGQSFNRSVAINFEAALASVLPTRLRGYQLPLRFIREVGIILDPSETLNIPCAMIVGKPGPGLTAIDILSKICISRPGDLVSADHEYCYLFLNACPQSVMLATLERILGVPVDVAFQDITFMVRREEIQSGLSALNRAAEQKNLPDYSAIVPSTLTTSPATAPNNSMPFQTSERATISNHDKFNEVPAHEGPITRPKLEMRAQVSRPVFKFSTPSLSLAVPIAEDPHVVTDLKFLNNTHVDPLERDILFTYSDTLLHPSFGRKEAPRATRTAPVSVLEASKI